MGIEFVALLDLGQERYEQAYRERKKKSFIACFLSLCPFSALRTPLLLLQGVKGGVHPNPSNIGELFREGSLNPYTEDPYAFD